MKDGEKDPAQPADPEKEGYRFTGWEKTVDPETGDVIYTAKWEIVPEPGKKVITYKDPSRPEGEQIVVMEIIDKDGDEPAQPPRPEREGYIFGGWDRTIDPSSGNVVYTAFWVEEKKPQPKISYLDPKAEDGQMILSAKRYDDQTAADAAMAAEDGKPADPSHDGYVFTGWALSRDKFGDYVLIAKYNQEAVTPEPEIRAVTYVDPQAEGDGMVLVSAAVGLSEEGTPDESGLEVPGSPSHKDMQFVGWVKSVDANGNVIYTAKYAPDCANVPPAPVEPTTVPEPVEGTTTVAPTTVPEPVEGTTEPWATVPPVPETTAPVISPTQALPTEPYRPTVPPATQPNVPDMGDPGSIAAWTIIGLTALNSLGITFLLNRKKREED